MVAGRANRYGAVTRRLVALVAVLVAVAAGCGGSGSKLHSAECRTALLRVDLTVWIANQPADYAPAAAACGLSRARLEALTRTGRRDFLRRYRAGLAGLAAGGQT